MRSLTAPARKIVEITHAGALAHRRSRACVLLLASTTLQQYPMKRRSKSQRTSTHLHTVPTMMPTPALPSATPPSPLTSVCVPPPLASLPALLSVPTTGLRLCASSSWVRSKIIGEKWGSKHPDANMYGETRSYTRHETFMPPGMTHLMRKDREEKGVKCPNVVFCANPGGECWSGSRGTEMGGVLARRAALLSLLLKV